MSLISINFSKPSQTFTLKEYKKASATANGFAGGIAYIGAALAGFPLGRIIDNFGWEGFFGSINWGRALVAHGRL